MCAPLWDVRLAGCTFIRLIQVCFTIQAARHNTHRVTAQASYDLLAQVQAAVAEGFEESITWRKALHVSKVKAPDADAAEPDTVQTDFLELPRCSTLLDSTSASALGPQLTVSTLLHGAGCTLQNGTIRVSADATLQLEGTLRFVNTTFVGASRTSEAACSKARAWIHFDTCGLFKFDMETPSGMHMTLNESLIC
jgi:hypothetical protein